MRANVLPGPLRGRSRWNRTVSHRVHSVHGENAPPCQSNGEWRWGDAWNRYGRCFWSVCSRRRALQPRPAPTPPAKREVLRENLLRAASLPPLLPNPTPHARARASGRHAASRARTAPPWQGPAPVLRERPPPPTASPAVRRAAAVPRGSPSDPATGLWHLVRRDPAFLGSIAADISMKWHCCEGDDAMPGDMRLFGVSEPTRLEFLSSRSQPSVSGAQSPCALAFP